MDVVSSETAPIVAQVRRSVPIRPRTGEEERTRLAREIHDGLAQDLWLAKLTAARLSAHPSLDLEGRAICAELLRSIESALGEARTAVTAMRSDDRGMVKLAELLEHQVDEFSDRFGIRAENRMDVGPVVPSTTFLEISRILQEALNNVRKHANARMVLVRLEHKRASIMLTIHDDGIGFDTRTANAGYGRQSMVERAESLGGRLLVISVPGRGTTISLRVPLVSTERR